MVRFIPIELWYSYYTNNLDPDLALSVILSSLIAYMPIWANLTLWPMSTFHSQFLSWHTASNFSSILIVFCWFFTWLALSDADLHFLVLLVTKANVVEGGITSPTWLYDQHNQSTHTWQWHYFHTYVNYHHRNGTSINCRHLSSTTYHVTHTLYNFKKLSTIDKTIS